ncbi:MAG: phosphoserine phosphatase SerB [Rhodobacter sp.]|nr:phosphoserine phosphatase SerB [Rhodobacter sp.]
MHVITLIANPERRDLERVLVESLRSAWGGGPTVWLAPGEAAEFEVPVVPGNRWEVWRDCQKTGIDLLVQRSGVRRKKLLLADMDSTLIRQECIDELAAEAGVGERVAAVTSRAMNGEIGFEDALRERVRLLKGLPVTVIGKVLYERIEYTPGGETAVATMKANGAYAALVSGGFTVFSAEVAARLGFDEHRANTLIEADGKLVGEVLKPILGRDAKVAALREIGSRLGFRNGDAIAVGDGANDLGMLALAGTGVAFRAKPSVAAQCELRVNHGDLTALLYIQGYSRKEFVSDQG